MYIYIYIYIGDVCITMPQPVTRSRPEAIQNSRTELYAENPDASAAELLSGVVDLLMYILISSSNVCIYIYMCMCIYIYIYIERERDVYRGRERERGNMISDYMM